jgi:hypothetical protein
VKKTIQPVAVGGVAGGEKFIVHGILFKFAVDFGGLYQVESVCYHLLLIVLVTLLLLCVER